VTTTNLNEVSGEVYQNLPVRTRDTSISLVDVIGADCRSNVAEHLVESFPGAGLEADCRDKDGSVDTFEMLLDGTSEIEQLTTPNNTAIPPLLKRSSSATDLDTIEFTPDLDAILSLVDAAVLAAVVGVGSLHNKNVSLKEVHSFRALSELAPAVFSPGHLRATAERVVLLPTIAHALLGARYRSRSKRDQTATPDLAKIFLSMQKGQSQVDAVRLSASLWHTTQSGVYDVTATKRLRPLNETIDDTACEVFPRGDILEVENDCADCGDILRDDCSDIDLFEQDLEDSEDLEDVNDILSDGDDSEYSHSESLLLDDEQCAHALNEELLFTPQCNDKLGDVEDGLNDIDLWEDLLDG